MPGRPAHAATVAEAYHTLNVPRFHERVRGLRP